MKYTAYGISIWAVYFSNTTNCILISLSMRQAALCLQLREDHLT